jgi:deoxycytidylate deaminase
MPSATIPKENEFLWQSLNQAREIALESARKSECIRRKYGAILFNEDHYIVGYNRRVSRCCDGECIRDLKSITHGHNTDLGAEIHAEQDLLLQGGRTVFKHSFLIAGYNKFGEEFYGLDNWPCYVCARLIISTNQISSVWVPDKDQTFSNYSIAEILESYDQEILGSLGDF